MLMPPTTRLVVAVLLPWVAALVIHPSQVAAFSVNVDEIAASSRNKLSAALASPSGKLTLSPELVIPEPRDATSILLLSNAVQTLSEGIRSCKANAALVQGSLTALQTFTNEQSTALGNFPGPVPVIYCHAATATHRRMTAIDDDVDTDADAAIDFVAIAQAGANGILVPIQSAVGSNDGTLSTLNVEAWTATCRAALEAGLQPVPEIVLAHEVVASWTSSDGIDALVSNVLDALGMVPVAILLTIDPVAALDDDNDNEQPVAIPAVAKTTTKRVPILGSVRVRAGENRLGDETMRFKEAGFSGTVLRSDCVPGFRLQPNLDIVSKFWQACITDLKSTRSKSFSFRAKNQMDVSAATKWGNYQRSVLDSGALGDPQESASLNEAAGEYQGF